MSGRLLLSLFFLALPALGQPLSLRQAGELTLSNNPTGHESQARVQADRARWGQSQAPFYPTITAATGYLTNDQREDGEISYEQDINIDLVGSQLLADFGKRRNSSDQARLNYEATQQANMAVQQSLLDKTARAYFGALSAAQAVFIQKESLRLARLRMEEAQTLYDRRKRPLEDLSLAESDISAIVVALIDAEAAERSARVMLANAMGMARSYDGPLLNCTLPYEALELTPALATAFEARPDLADARLRSSSAQSGVWASQAAYRPDIYVTAAYGFLDKGVTPQDYLWEVRLNLSFPILNEPFLSESVNLAEAEKAQAVARQQTKENDVSSEVQRALIEARGNQMKASASRRSVLKAYSTFILTWTSYRLGKGSARDVSNAQRDLTSALNTQNTVFTELQLSVIEVYRSTGQLTVAVLPAVESEQRTIYWPLFDQEVSQ